MYVPKDIIEIIERYLIGECENNMCNIIGKLRLVYNCNICEKCVENIHKLK